MPSNCLSVSALGWYRRRIHGIQFGRVVRHIVCKGKKKERAAANS
jgi:hypothetical protein